MKPDRRRCAARSDRPRLESGPDPSIRVRGGVGALLFAFRNLAMKQLTPSNSPTPSPDSKPGSPCAHLLTIRVGRRGAPLNAIHLASEFHAAVHLLALERWWRVRCTVLLPRVAHLIVALAPEIDSTTAAEELKRRLAPCLRRAGQTWATGYETQFLGSQAEIGDALVKLYREPCRVGLCTEGEVWPGYLCSDDDRAWLVATTALNSKASDTVALARLVRRA